MRLIIILLCLFPTHTVAESVEFSGGDILGFISADFTQDGNNERIVLFMLDEPVLSIFTRWTDGSWANPLFAEGLVEGRNYPDPDPTIALTDNGSIEVRSLARESDPGQWVKTLTIAYRQTQGFDCKRYVVAGVKYEWNAGGNAEDRRICEINLLTRQGELTHVAKDTVTGFYSQIGVESVDKWPRDMIPEQCFGG
jgi:hypothetical protein